MDHFYQQKLINEKIELQRQLAQTNSQLKKLTEQVRTYEQLINQMLPNSNQSGSEVDLTNEGVIRDTLEKIKNTVRGSGWRTNDDVTAIQNPRQPHPRVQARADAAAAAAERAKEKPIFTAHSVDLNHRDSSRAVRVGPHNDVSGQYRLVRQPGNRPV